MSTKITCETFTSYSVKNYDPAIFLEKISQDDRKTHQQALKIFKKNGIVSEENLSAKTFSLNLKNTHVGLMRVRGKGEEPSSLFDIRIVDFEEGNLGQHTLCFGAFKISEEGSISSLNSGYLKINYYDNNFWKNKTPPIEGMTSWLSICNIDAWDKEHRLGSALLYFAIEKALDLSKKEINLISSTETGTFYAKFGFACKTKEREELVREAYFSGSQIKGLAMQLSPESLEIWKQRIAKSVILTPKTNCIVL